MRGASGKEESTYDPVSRYFLRCFAIAARKRHIAASTPFHNALAETTLVFIGLPAIAVLSFVGLSSLKWWNPALTALWPDFSFRWVALAIWVVCVVIGHLTIGRRFSEYRQGAPRTLEFDSDQDRRIAFWQKTIVFILCAIASPWLGILVSKYLE